MPERPQDASVTVERIIAAPPALVWALVADTNRIDRATGLVAGEYDWEERVAGDANSRSRVARAKQLGFSIKWIEPPYEWVESRFVRGERLFVEGPVQRGGFAVELEPKGQGTLLRARVFIGGDGWFARLVASVMRQKMRAPLERYLEAIESVLAKRPLAYRADDEPPAAAAARVLMNERPEAIATGERTPTDEADLAHRASKLAAAPVSPEMVERLVAMVRERPDEELASIRPFEVARAWGRDRREVLAAFLHASRAGLFELSWQLNCPTCRVGSERRSSLAEVRTTAHCDACQIEFALDFSQHVEAQFRVSPSLRKIEPRVYCASSPWFRPHVLAELAATGGAPRTVRMPLPTGELLVRTLGGARRRETIEIGAARPARLRVSIDEGSLSLASEGEAAEGEDTEVRIESASDAVVLFERSGWHADLVFGSTIASMPEFLDLFATEAPALGMELSVGTLTVLFSDLTGSTALYERIGDARAYAVVGEHFADMTTAVQSAGGAIVKTMGDAVMATFTSPADALTASCAMVAACERAHGDLGLSVKIGFHEGPCLAVRANDRLDYFGTTVNVAARLQAKAEGSEIVVIESLLEHPALAAMRRKLALPERRFTASLKGIQNEQRLVGLDAHDIGARTR